MRSWSSFPPDRSMNNYLQSIRLHSRVQHCSKLFTSPVILKTILLALQWEIFVWRGPESWKFIKWTRNKLVKQAPCKLITWVLPYRESPFIWLCSICYSSQQILVQKESPWSPFSLGSKYYLPFVGIRGNYVKSLQTLDPGCKMPARILYMMTISTPIPQNFVS